MLLTSVKAMAAKKMYLCTSKCYSSALGDPLMKSETGLCAQRARRDWRLLGGWFKKQGNLTYGVYLGQLQDE